MWEAGLFSVIQPNLNDEYLEHWKPRSPRIKQIPLQSVYIVASVLHAVAQVELTQIYVNKEDEPIEAIYYFPIDSNGGVTHFHAELEGRNITGQVKTVDEARAQYEKAIDSKQEAFLLESNKPDIFKVRVGFLKPGSQVKIVIGYVTEVKNEKGSNAIRFFIPTTVAPRYIGPTEMDEDADDLAKMTFSECSPAKLSITVNVAIQGEIKSIVSPSHKIKIEKKNNIMKNWHRAVVTLRGPLRDMDRDFVLLITPEDVHVPRLYSEKVGDSNALMTHLIPSFKLHDVKVELLFALDRSGSMQGNSIELAKKALKLFLHSLPVDCYFNIVGFGSTFQFLFPESVKYDEASLTLAISHAKNMRADLGGTEIMQPLKAIFQKDVIPGYFRQILVLTDGEVSNTDQVIGICRFNAETSRVFALGIGHAASHHLVEGIAEAGGGLAVFATNNEIMDSKVLQLLQTSTQPSLTNVKINWTGMPPTTSKNSKTYWEVPHRIRPIFDGAQMIVFGVFPKVGPNSVEIIAESPDGPLSIQIELSVENEIGSNAGPGGEAILHKLAAIKAIRELELKLADLIFHNREDNEEVEAVKAEIIKLAIQNELASKYTSFVAVDPGNIPIDGKIEPNWIMQPKLRTRYVPSQNPNHGSIGGLGNMVLHNAVIEEPIIIEQVRVSTMPPPPERSDGGNSNSEGCLSVPQPTSAQVKIGETVDKNIDKALKTPRDKLLALIATQSFDGYFSLNEEFSFVIGKPLHVLVEEAKKNRWKEDAWATALALTYMAEILGDLKESYVLVDAKGRNWLQQNFGDQMESMLLASLEIFKHE